MSILDDLASELAIDTDSLRASLLGGESEALTPNYLTVNPDGTTGADFSGSISAKGIIFPEGNANRFPPALADANITWENANGAAVAAISGFQSIGVTGDFPNVVEVGSYGNAGVFTGYLQTIATDSHGVSVKAGNRLRTAPGVYAVIEKTLIDSSSQSDFLQLLLTGKARLAFGTSLVNIPNGTSNGTLPVGHGLGTTPIVAWANARNNPPLSVAAAKITAVDGTNVTIQAYTANLGAVSAAINITCDWFAIG